MGRGFETDDLSLDIVGSTPTDCHLREPIAQLQAQVGAENDGWPGRLRQAAQIARQSQSRGISRRGKSPPMKSARSKPISHFKSVI